MKNINFLTKRYKEKLELEEYIRKSGGIILIFLILIYLGILGITPIENNLKISTSAQEQRIENITNNIEAIKIKSEQEDSIDIEIKRIEKILSKEDVKIYKLLEILENSISRGMVLESFVYQNGEIRIKGIDSNFEKNIRGNIYSFEKKLIDSNKFQEVKLSYLKEELRVGKKIKEFEYILILR